MIKSIRLRELRNFTFIEFIKALLSLVLDRDPAALKVKGPYDALFAQTSKAELILKTHSSNLVTEELMNMDDERDDLFNGLRYSVEAALRHPQPAMQLHARVLENSLNQFGTGVTNLDYNTETGVIHRLVNDWKTEADLKQAMEALGLTEWVNKLEEVNNSFREKYLARTKQEGAGPLKPFGEERQETVALYYKLRDYLDSLYVLNEGADPYGALTNEINALIDKYNNISRPGKGNDTPPVPDASQATGVN